MATIVTRAGKGSPLTHEEVDANFTNLNDEAATKAPLANPVFTGDVAIADKIVHSGDTNTAIRFPAADTVTVETSGAERLRVDSSGNLGLGVTPSAWSWGGRVIDGTNNMVVSAGGPYGVFATNVFWNGTNWAYKSTAAAARYDQNTSAHAWFTAPSGTAGNAITFTQAMTLNASGRLGIGTTSPAERLNVVGGYANFAGLRIAGTDHDASNNIYLASGTLSLSTGSAAGIVFKTNLTERACIDASGNVGIGTTSPAATLDVAGTGAMKVPVGTDAQRPTSATGLLRFNTDAASFEGYNGTEWGSIGGGATSDAIYENSATIAENITIATGRNGMSTGPVTINSGVTVTVSSGARYVVI